MNTRNITQSDYELTKEERENVYVLVIESESLEQNSLRTALADLGFGNISHAPDHVTGLKRCGERRFDIVMFDANDSTMPAMEFLDRLLLTDEDVLAIPCSADPGVDDVFEMIKRGARGFLARPFTAESLAEVLTVAAKGEPLSEQVLVAEDRNAAFAVMLITHLDNAAKVARESRKYDSAARELADRLQRLKESAKLARTFSEGGEEAMLRAIETLCLSRCDGPATRLGRARRRLKEMRDNPTKAAKNSKKR